MYSVNLDKTINMKPIGDREGRLMRANYQEEGGTYKTGLSSIASFTP